MVDKGIPSDSTNVRANYLRTLSPEELKRMEESREFLQKFQDGKIREEMKKLGEKNDQPVERTGYDVPAEGEGKKLDIGNINDLFDRLGEKEVQPVPLLEPTMKPTLIDGREVKPVQMPKPDIQPVKIDGKEVQPVRMPEFKPKLKAQDGTDKEAKPEQTPPADNERTVDLYGKKYKIKKINTPLNFNVGARDVVIDGKTIHLAPGEQIEFLSSDTY